MSDHTLAVALSEHEKEWYDQESTEQNTSQSELGRRHLRTGWILWDSGELDSELLSMIETGWIESDDLRDALSKNGGEHQSSGTSNSPQPVDGDITEMILQNIPHEDSGSGVSDDELMSVVFGNEEERKKSLDTAIEELFGDKITRRHDGKLVRTTDE